jgi:uncharacterized RDD family membrane protein YckC
MDDAEPCSFCDDSSENSEKLQPVAAGGSPIEVSPEPEWRVEVSRRLEQYRARRRGARSDENQSALPFREPSASKSKTKLQIQIEQRIELPERPRPRLRSPERTKSPERIEICIQPELDFAPAPGERARPQTAMVPVATLSERRRAGIIDAVFILLTCAAFMGLFVGLIRSMDGEMMIDRTDALMAAPVIFLFYALYFLVFTIFAGVTPGMQLCSLSVVRLDGRLPDTSQLLWRSVGYLISGATLMLGFLWSLWDEDRFTWQDRISQTYLTSTDPLTDPDPIEFAQSRRKPAR